MRRKKRQTLSLQRQIVIIILLCWLIPVLMVLGIMGWYFSDSILSALHTAKSKEDAALTRFGMWWWNSL